MVPDSAPHAPVVEAAREYVMVIPAPPDKVVVICPVNVTALAPLQSVPVMAMAPDEDTVPKVKGTSEIPWLPLVIVNTVPVNTPFANVVVNVPEALSQLMLQFPV